MKPHLLLHIGIRHAGGPELRRVLLAQRGWLRRGGTLLGHSAGNPDHRLLAAAAMEDPASVWGAWPEPPDGLTGTERVARFRQRLANDMHALPAGVRHVVFSDESLAHLLDTRSRIAALAALLLPFFAAARIVVYLRRQDLDWASCRDDDLRVGRDEAATPPHGPGLDYAALLANWASVFGEAAIVPRLHEPGALTGGSIAADFAHAAGIELQPFDSDAPDGIVAPCSVTAETFLRQAADRLRAQVPDGSWRDATSWQRLLANATRLAPGAGWQPDAASAQTCRLHFAASNDAARARWFSARASLFTEASTPAPPAAPPSAADVHALALAVLVTEASTLRRIEADAAVAQYRLWRRLNDVPQMRAALQRALREDPDLLSARIALAEFSAEQGAGAEALSHAEAALRIAPADDTARQLAARLRAVAHSTS